ncbi:unnamed protein product [Urochloa humidicola]
MDLSTLDPAPDQAFLAKVRSSFGSPVTSPSPDDAYSFWLLASFSRSRFHLDAHSVGFILQSVLGAVPPTAAPENRPSHLNLDLSLGATLPSNHPEPDQAPSLNCLDLHATTHQESPSATVPPPVGDSSAMAFRFVDPTPFIPHGFNRVMVPGRRAMIRVFLGNPVRRNLELAIATIDPLPEHQVTFPAISHIVEEFLHEGARAGYEYIRPCPLGQAFVKFTHFHDRDRLIHGSPHAFGPYSIYFVEHDRGWNHRAVTLNHEVWLLLLGTNIDYWSERHFSKVLGDHGQLIAWEENAYHPGRVLIKARVVSLEAIPWFIVSTEGFAFDGDSWTIQTEIIQTRMLGAHGGDEDQPPGPDDVQPQLFDFFGFGQPRNAPQQPNPNAAPADNADGWGLWPQAPVAPNNG